MSGSESIMSIFVLSPALGTPLTLPTAVPLHCSQPATVNTRSWKLVLIWQKMVANAWIVCFSTYFVTTKHHWWLVFGHVRKVASEKSTLQKNQKRCALCFGSLGISPDQKQWCLLAVGTQADSTSDHGQPSNIRISEQCNATVFFSAKYSILIFPRFHHPPPLH